MLLQLANHRALVRVLSAAVLGALVCGATAASAANKDTVGAGGFPLLTTNGVVVLRGLVYDDWDVRAAIRISKRVAGVKRVINQLEIGGQP